MNTILGIILFLAGALSGSWLSSLGLTGSNLLIGSIVLGTIGGYVGAKLIFGA